MKLRIYTGVDNLIEEVMAIQSMVQCDHSGLFHT